MCRDGGDLFGRGLACDDRRHELRDGRAGTCGSGAVLDREIRLQRGEFLVAVRGVDIGEICLDIRRALLLERRGILFASVEQGLRHVRVHVVADDAILAHVRLLEAVGEDLRDLFLHIAAL